MTNRVYPEFRGAVVAQMQLAEFHAKELGIDAQKLLAIAKVLHDVERDYLLAHPNEGHKSFLRMAYPRR